MRSMCFVTLSLAFLVLVTWRTASEANLQQPTALSMFLSTVDVDGDGVHTHGDRAVMEWWIAHGGNPTSAMSAAEPQGAVQSVRAFLESPAAQLNP